MAALGEASITPVRLDVPQVDVVDLVRVVVGDGQDIVGAGRGEAADAQGQPVLRAGIKSCIKLLGGTLGYRSDVSPRRMSEQKTTHTTLTANL